MEIVCCGNVTGGSNPLLCAKKRDTQFCVSLFVVFRDLKMHIRAHDQIYSLKNDKDGKSER